jgi:hypothetical protein
MKFTTHLSAGICAGVGALVLAGTGVTTASAATSMTATSMTATSMTAPRAATVHAAPAAHRTPTAAQAMAAWVNSPGYSYLNATDSALDSRNGRALAKYATLAAEHPQPVDTAKYVSVMREYAAAGTELVHGQTRAANAKIGDANDTAWDVLQDTFAVISRVSISG